MAALTRKVKRVLPDEQNEVLDALRRAQGAGPTSPCSAVEAAARAAASARATVLGWPRPTRAPAARPGGRRRRATADARHDLARELVDAVRGVAWAPLAGGTPSTDVGGGAPSA